MLTQTLKRFTDKVDKTSDCWNWTASCDGKGYGQFVYKVFANARQKKYYWRQKNA